MTGTILIRGTAVAQARADRTIAAASAHGCGVSNPNIIVFFKRKLNQALTFNRTSTIWHWPAWVGQSGKAGDPSG